MCVLHVCAFIMATVGAVSAADGLSGPLVNCTKPFEIIARDIDDPGVYVQCRFYVPHMEQCPKYQVLSLKHKRCIFPDSLIKPCNRK